MSNNQRLQIVSPNFETTEALGRKIGGRLRGGEVIELKSDLGGGKTTFVRGLAAGIGSTDAVASPSFTISRVYSSPQFDLHHYDFYRLAEAGLMADELSEVIGDPKNVTVVEWADVVEDVLPDRHIEIDILMTGENERQISLAIPEQYDYVREVVA